MEGTKTLFFSDGDVTSALSVVLSNTPREPHELPATLRAWGGSGGAWGRSVLFRPLSASGGATQHRWRFGHDLAISVMT